MRALRLALLPVLLYLSMDFASPLLPGAINFDPDDRVDALRAARPRAVAERLAVVPLPTCRILDRPEDDRAPDRRLVIDSASRRGVVRARDPRHLSPDHPSSAAADH